MTRIDPPGGTAARRCRCPPGARPRACARRPGEVRRRPLGARPLLSRAAELPNPDGFTDLLSPADVDELLSRRGLRTPFLRIAKDGEVLPAARYTGGGGAGAEIGDQVLDDAVLQLYADGATLVLQGLHRIWPPLIDFARRPGRRRWASPLQVNAYLTPPAARASPPTTTPTTSSCCRSTDASTGASTRRCCADPLERQPWGGRADEVAATADGEPALDVVLGPGRRPLPAARLAAQRPGAGPQLAAPDRRASGR